MKSIRDSQKSSEPLYLFPQTCLDYTKLLPRPAIGWLPAIMGTMTSIAPQRLVPLVAPILLVLILHAHAQSGLGAVTGAITDPMCENNRDLPHLSRK